MSGSTRAERRQKAKEEKKAQKKAAKQQVKAAIAAHQPGNDDGSESDSSSADESVNAYDKPAEESVKRQSDAGDASGENKETIQKARKSMDSQPIHKDATPIAPSRVSSEIKPGDHAAKKAPHAEILTEKPTPVSLDKNPAPSEAPSTHEPTSDANKAPPPVAKAEEPRADTKKQPAPVKKTTTTKSSVGGKEAPAESPSQDTSARQHATSENKKATEPVAPAKELPTTKNKTESKSESEASKSAVDETKKTAETPDSKQEDTGRDKGLPVRPPPKDSEKKGLFGLFKKGTSSSEKKQKSWQFWK